ncbi:MAG: methyltransferase domain-containing protein [Nanoarchaeota archaeon]|nr:methyltransferase domain-containing protein [Nanoarchaeota archaeon]
MTYQPSDDTFLLLNSIKDDIKENNISTSSIKVCEVGCGSGEIITTLKEKFTTINAYASDINHQAIEDAVNLAQQKNVNINAKVGSFLEPFEDEKFDIILFNTPYLPCEDGERFDKLSIEDKALYGGKAGFEVTNQFLDSLHNSIHENTIIYMLISTLTQPNVVEDCIVGNGFSFEVVARQNHFFEELLVYRIIPANVLCHLMTKKYTNIKRFDKGRHSHIIQAQVHSSKQLAMVKFGKKQHIEKEIFFLLKLQDANYAPQIIESGIDTISQEGFVIYKKIQGMKIEEFIQTYIQTYDSIIPLEKVLNRILEICFDLDVKGISKDEMTHPQEHIFIKPDNVGEIYFIDFERSILQDRFSNSRQFLQYCIKIGRVFEHFGIILSREKCIIMGKEIIQKNTSILIQEIYE